MTLNMFITKEIHIVISLKCEMKMIYMLFVIFSIRKIIFLLTFIFFTGFLT